MTGRLILHATNVHQGGGRALLEALFKACSTQNIVLLLDSRMHVPAESLSDCRVIRVRPTILDRLWAEWWLAKHVRATDTVLCFGNLPPLFKLPGHVVVFVQNKYLLERIALTGLSWKTKLRLTVERRWFGGRVCNSDLFIVQTPAMRGALEARLRKLKACSNEMIQSKTVVPIRILPFVTEVAGYQREGYAQQMNGNKEFDFFYVASGEPHKNHHRLIEAWCLLAEQGYFPFLAITVDQTNFPDLCEWINKKKTQHYLQLENLGVLALDQVKRRYRQVGALIYPSVFESFGLPLIEARQAGLPILAAELDYVRDVLDPEETFDPASPVSIARAVKRFLKIKEPPLPLQDAETFINHILKRAE